MGYHDGYLSFCSIMMLSMFFVSLLILNMASLGLGFQVPATRRAARSFPTVTTERSMMMPGNGLFEAYDWMLTHHQLPTESITAASLAAMGDVAAQVRGETKGVDMARVQAFFVKGAVGGILWSYWYSTVDPLTLDWASQLVGENEFFVNPMRVVLSTFLDEIVFCPFLFATWDLPFPMLCRGDPVHSIPRQVSAKLVPVVVENTKVWTVANLVIYSLPLHYRVSVSVCTDAVWQMILSEKINEPVVVAPPPTLPLAAQDEEALQLPNSATSPAMEFVEPF